MFIRVKSTPNSPRKSVQICKNVRENGKVRQKVVRHVGIAENEIHLLELKNIAKMIKLQILEDEKGPFLIDKNDFLSSETSNPLVENSQNSEVISLSDDTPPLFVDLHNMREKQRIVEGFHEVFGKLYR